MARILLLVEYPSWANLDRTPRGGGLDRPRHQKTPGFGGLKPEAREQATTVSGQTIGLVGSSGVGSEQRRRHPHAEHLSNQPNGFPRWKLPRKRLDPSGNIPSGVTDTESVLGQIQHVIR